MQSLTADCRVLHSWHSRELHAQHSQFEILEHIAHSKHTERTESTFPMWPGWQKSSTFCSRYLCTQQTEMWGVVIFSDSKSLHWDQISSHHHTQKSRFGFDAISLALWHSAFSRFVLVHKSNGQKCHFVSGRSRFVLLFLVILQNMRSSSRNNLWSNSCITPPAASHFSFPLKGGPSIPPPRKFLQK